MHYLSHTCKTGGFSCPRVGFEVCRRTFGLGINLGAFNESSYATLSVLSDWPENIKRDTFIKMSQKVIHLTKSHKVPEQMRSSHSVIEGRIIHSVTWYCDKSSESRQARSRMGSYMPLVSARERIYQLGQRFGVAAVHWAVWSTICSFKHIKC